MIHTENYPLTPDSIDIISARAVEFMRETKIDGESIQRNRLFLEEVLLTWMSAKISDTVSLCIGFRLKKPYISVEAFGVPCNVLEKNTAEDAVLLRNLLGSIGRLPIYSYRNGKNAVQLSFTPKKRNKLVQILIAIAAGVVSGLLLNLILPEALSGALLTDIINPLYSAAFRILGYISGPLIFLSVMWGIYGIGDASTLGLIGKKIILKFLLIIFVIAFSSIGLVVFFKFNLQSSTTGESAFKSIFEMVLDIFPANIIQPFLNGNTLQLIFTAVIFGIAILFLGKRVSTVADLIEQINCIVQFLMSFISEMIPYFIYLVILRLILNKTLTMFSSVWKLFAMFIGAVLLLCSIFTVVTSVKHRVSPILIIKKSIPTFLIAITTASSAAAFSSNMETCEKKFGIDRSLCAFGIPLGMVMFKTSTTAYYMLVSFFFARQFGVAVSFDWLITAAFMSAMLAIATPPIPGGGVAAYTMLFARLAIPEDALAIVLTMDIIFDFVRTAANMYNLPLELLSCAAPLGKLDTATLQSRSSAE